MVSHRKTVIVHWKLVQTPIFSTAYIVRQDPCQVTSPHPRACTTTRRSHTSSRLNKVLLNPQQVVLTREWKTGAAFDTQHSAQVWEPRPLQRPCQVASALCTPWGDRDRETVRLSVGRGRGGGGGWVNGGVTWRNNSSNALYGLGTWQNCEWMSFLIPTMSEERDGLTPDLPWLSGESMCFEQW